MRTSYRIAVSLRGVRVPAPAYLAQAQALCRKFGTLVVLDEVQTGLGRSGKFLASHHYDVEPDMVVLAKALSGGLIPTGAVLMSEAIFGSVYDSLKRAIIHTSTYSENALAMRAWLATLEVLEEEQLAVRAERLGEMLRRRLREVLEDFEMVQEVRGVGLLCGVAFQAPKQLKLCVPFRSFSHRPSSNVRADDRAADVQREGIPDTDLRKQLHGAEGLTAARRR